MQKVNHKARGQKDANWNHTGLTVGIALLVPPCPTRTYTNDDWLFQSIIHSPYETIISYRIDSHYRNQLLYSIAILHSRNLNDNNHTFQRGIQFQQD